MQILYGHLELDTIMVEAVPCIGNAGEPPPGWPRCFELIARGKLQTQLNEWMQTRGKNWPTGGWCYPVCLASHPGSCKSGKCCRQCCRRFCHTTLWCLQNPGKSLIVLWCFVNLWSVHYFLWESSFFESYLQIKCLKLESLLSWKDEGASGAIRSGTCN